MPHRIAVIVAGAGIASAGLGFVLAQSPAPPPAAIATGRVVIDASRPGAAIPPRLYGIFYEEINHAGGGLYAELVRNRGFEDANLPPACVREGNAGATRSRPSRPRTPSWAPPPGIASTVIAGTTFDSRFAAARFAAMSMAC